MKVCPISNKKSLVGGGYSNRTRATQFNPIGSSRRQPNFQKKTIYIPELKKSIRIMISTTAMRTIAKNGAFKVLKKAGLI